VINPPEKKKRNYWVDGFSNDDPESWLSSARSVPGSWWPHWMEWLGRRAGKRVNAPAQPGGAGHAVIEAAPGRYVTVRAD